MAFSWLINGGDPNYLRYLGWSSKYPPPNPVQGALRIQSPLEVWYWIGYSRPTPSMGRFGIFTYTWMVDFYGINIDKYTSHMGDDSLDFFGIGTISQIFIMFFCLSMWSVFLTREKKGWIWVLKRDMTKYLQQWATNIRKPVLPNIPQPSIHSMVTFWRKSRENPVIAMGKSTFWIWRCIFYIELNIVISIALLGKQQPQVLRKREPTRKKQFRDSRVESQ